MDIYWNQLTFDAQRLKWFRLLYCTLLATLMFAGQSLAQEVTLSVPTAILPRTEIEVVWRGPDAPGDFIVIAEPDAPAATYFTYARTSKGSPAVLIAPEIGDYEVRYISATGLVVLAKLPLNVGAKVSSRAMTVPSEAEAGTELVVSVSDTGEAIDYITIVEAGAPDIALGPYARLRGALEVSLKVPDTPGEYELRHIQVSSQTILSRARLTITAPVKPTGPENDEAPEPETAFAGDTVSEPVVADTQPTTTVLPSLLALIAVDRDHEFSVSWSGPEGAGDRIEIRADGPDAEVFGNQLVTAGSPVQFTAPDMPGTYEIVYVDSASGSVLARRELEVR